MKTKSIIELERKISSVEGDDMRKNILEAAKGFKTSWISFGQALYAVWKDRLYKQWGYDKFETYTLKEMGIRKQTAIKLLRSYSFLEKEDPLYLNCQYNAETDTALVPTYEAVDVLRLAKNKKGLDSFSYAAIRKSVLELGKDPSSVKKDLTALMKQQQDIEPEEAWLKKRTVILKRFVTTLKAIIAEARASNMISIKVINDAEKIADTIELEIN